MQAIFLFKYGQGVCTVLTKGAEYVVKAVEIES